MGKNFPKRFAENSNDFRGQLMSYVINDNPNFTNFPEFKQSVTGTFEWLDENDYLTEERAVLLFEEPEVRNQLERNIGKKEAEKMYEGLEEGIPEERISKEKPTITIKYIQVKASRRSKEHTRIQSQKWTPSQTRFLKVRKEKGLPRKQIIKEYHEEFTPRTHKSISSKIYRI